MTQNHADGTRVENPFTLPEELFNKWVKLAEELLQLSGERLAFILNEIIEHKRHKEAHKEGRGLPSRKAAVNVEKKKATSKTGGAHSQTHKPHHTAHGIPTKTAPGIGGDLGQWYKQLKIEERRRSRSNALYNGFIAAVLV